MKSHLGFLAVATVIAMLSSGAAQAAASIAVPAPGLYTYSQEGLALSGTTAVTLPNVVVTFGNNLTYQDDILITLAGTDALVPDVTPTLVACSGAGGNALGYVSLVPGGWKFRVTDVSGITLGASCTFSGLKVTAASLSSTSGVLTYQANRGLTTPTVVVDGPVTSGPVIVAKSQFDIAVSPKLNGIINIYAARKVFFDAETISPGNLPPPNGVRADTLNFNTFNSGNPAVGTWTGPTVVPTSNTITISGDFSWVDGTDTDATCDVDEFPSRVVGYVGWSIGPTSDCTKLVLSQTLPVGNSAAQGYFFVAGDIVLSPTDYEGSVEWVYALDSNPAATSKTIRQFDPGAWTLNAAQVYIQYMPYGRDISRIVYAANRGAAPVAVTADITANGSKFTCSLGNAQQQSVTQLSLLLDVCVFMQGITQGKVSILLTFVAPEQDIEVYSAYLVGTGDIGTVVNTSNGRSFFYGTGVNFTPTPIPGP
jgi:hypothetical protein